MKDRFHIYLCSPNLDPVLTVVGCHQGLQFISTSVERWTFIDTLRQPLQQTNLDIYSDTENSTTPGGISSILNPLWMEAGNTIEEV